MKTMTKKMKKQRGQSVVEYCLVTAAVVLGVIAASFIPDMGSFSLKGAFKEHFNKCKQKIIGQK